VHGANRLASNSLLEALVFAGRSADVLPEVLATIKPRVAIDIPSFAGRVPVEGAVLVHDRDEIRSLMWDLVGIVRTDERLEIATQRLHQMAEQYEGLWSRHAPSPEFLELRNLVDTASLIVESACSRRESRGLHFNLDHPHRDNERFLSDTILRRS
jgi:L-aspartate oxidase